ncbi:MAG: hypothetical protein ISS23_03040 [Nanoarchaeota archaeon]|nr:hypothetical protein [Nanoarchaeota archaeon]
MRSISIITILIIVIFIVGCAEKTPTKTEVSKNIAKVKELSKEVVEEKEESPKKTIEDVTKGDYNAFREKLLQIGKKYFDFNIETGDWEYSEKPNKMVVKLPIMKYDSGEKINVNYYYVEPRGEATGKEIVNGKKVSHQGFGTDSVRWYGFHCNVGKLDIYHYSASSARFDITEMFPSNDKNFVSDLIDVCKAEPKDIKP